MPVTVHHQSQNCQYRGTRQGSSIKVSIKPCPSLPLPCSIYQSRRWQDHAVTVFLDLLCPRYGSLPFSWCVKSRSLTSFSALHSAYAFRFASNSRMSICACAVLLSVFTSVCPGRLVSGNVASPYPLKAFLVSPEKAKGTIQAAGELFSWISTLLWGCQPACR